MFNPMDLSGRRILVTGASSGIGRACAVVLSKLGASVAVCARREDELGKTLSAMEGTSHSAVVCDLSVASGIGKAVAEAGRLDGLVHAAGIFHASPAAVFDANGARAAFDINCVAFLELMKHCARAKNRGERFSAVAVSSVSAFAGWPGGGAYCASKGALSAAVRALAVELAPKGIRVNAVCPSNVKTPLYDNGAALLNGEDALDGIIAKQPLGLGMPDQIAEAVAFLVSDASRFVTGVNLPVDGGYLAQ